MNMASNKISLTSIGDCCVDIYPDQNRVFLGGTAFNVAYHAQKAGAIPSIVSVVGDDAYGQLFFKMAKENNINADYLVLQKGKTSNVLIPLDKEGKPIFSGWDLGVLESFILTNRDEQFLKTQDAAKAILLKPLKSLFTSFCQMHLSKTFKVGDFAGGSMYSEDINVIQNYIQDLNMIVRSVDFKNKKELSFLKQLAQKYDKLILASLGANGSIIFTKDNEYFEPAIKINVTDTTGAGDAYIGYFLVSYLQTKDIPNAMKEATKAAAKVVIQFGANI